MILATITGILLTSSGALVPSEQGVSVPLGSTATLPIVVTDSNGGAINLTGGSLTLTARDQTLAPILSVAAVLTAPLGGQAQFYLPSSIWTAIVQGAYQYDVWYIDSAGNQAQVVAPGLFLVTRKVPDVLPGSPTSPPRAAYYGAAFVFAPAGVAGGNVYTDEVSFTAAVMGAFANTLGPVDAFISGTAAFNSPHNWQGRVRWSGATANPSFAEAFLPPTDNLTLNATQTDFIGQGNGVSNMGLYQGASVSAPTIACVNFTDHHYASVQLVNLHVTTPMCNIGAGQIVSVQFTDGSDYSTAGGLDTSSVYYLTASNSFFVTAGYDIASPLVPHENLCGGVPGSRWFHTGDSGWIFSSVGNQFQGTLAQLLVDTARGTIYTPTVAAHWPAVPTTVTAALDSLAARYGVTESPQLTWYVDAQNSTGLASDANSGLTSGAPLLHNSEIAVRFGTTEPDFGSPATVVTINQLSNTNASDPANITPKNGAVVVVAPLTQVATGTLSAVTVRNQGPVGAAKWNITTASFSSWTPYLNCLVQDTTTASWFVVEADTGGGSATVTQPTKDTRQVSMTATGGRTLTFSAAAHTIAGSSGSFVTDGFTAGQILIISGTTSNNGNAGIIATVAAGLITLNAGIVNEGPLSSLATLTSVGVVLNSLVTPLVNDAFTVWQPGVVHVTELGGVSVNGAVIIQNANVTPIVPGYTINLYGGVVAQHCVFSGYIAASSLALEAATGNNQSGKPAFTTCVALKGCDLFDYYWMGGAIWGSFVLRAEGSQALLGGGVYLNGTTTPMSFTGGGRHQIGDVGIFTSPATALNLLGGGQGRQTTGVISSGTDPCTGATACIWGTTNWPIKSLGNHMLKVGAAAELKVNGSITLCGASSGATYTPSTGVTTANTAVTLGSNSTGQASAAIDAAISGGATGVIAPGNFAGIIKET